MKHANALTHHHSRPCGRPIAWIVIWFLAGTLWTLCAPAQPLTRQEVIVTTTPAGGYLLRGEQNAVTITKRQQALMATYRAPTGLDIVCLIEFGGRLHLEWRDQRLRVINSGPTLVKVTVQETTFEAGSGAQVTIAGNQDRAEIANTTDLFLTTAYAAGDLYADALLDREATSQYDKTTLALLEITYRDAWATALQEGASAPDAAQQAADRLAQRIEDQDVRREALNVADATAASARKAVERMLARPASVRIGAAALMVGDARVVTPPIVPAATPAAVEPGERGRVLVDSGFRPARHGFGFANYGGEYPHGDLRNDEARAIFGDQVCEGFDGDSCLAAPVTYIWVSRLNRALQYGHCEGMAVLSALLFNGQEDPQQFGAEAVFSLRPSNPAVLQKIAMYAAMQTARPIWQEAGESRQQSLDELLKILTTALRRGPQYTMGLYTSAGAQTVLPYAVEEFGDGVLGVHVYDPNYPGEGRVVEIDPAGDVWRYDGLEGGAGTLDLTTVAARQQRLPFPFAPDAATTLLVDIQSAELTITAPDGRRIAASPSEITNQIPGALVARLRGKEALFGEERGASLEERIESGDVLPLVVSLPPDAEYALAIRVAGEPEIDDTLGPDGEERGKEALLGEERGKEALLGEERGKEALLGEERGKEALLGEERGKEALLGEERGKEALLGEERGKEALLGEERGKEALFGEERGTAGPPPEKPIWMIVLQAERAYLVDRIVPAPGVPEQITLTAAGGITYRAGAAQRLTVVAGTAVPNRADARHTIQQIPLSPGHAFTVAVAPQTGTLTFSEDDPELEALNLVVRVEDGRSSRRYAYKPLQTAEQGQNWIEVQADGRFRMGLDVDADGRGDDLRPDADDDGVPDGFAVEPASGIEPGAQGALVADTGFRPDANGFSFQNYAQNQYPYGDLTTDDAWRMFGDQVCETVQDGRCFPAPATQLWVTKMNQSMQRGHCEGMAVLSIWLYTGEETVQGFSGTRAYHLDPSYEALLRKIAYYWTTQTLEPVKSSYYAFREYTPTEILQVLIEAMHNGTETYTIGIYDRGGHAVTPYAVEDVGAGVFWVHVYDNNYPGAGKYIEIDTNADTWRYAGAALNPANDASPWQGGPGTMDLTPSSARQQPLDCSFCKPEEPEKQEAATLTVMVDGNGMQASARTPDGQQISMTNGQVTNDIPGAQMTRVKGSDDLEGAQQSTVFGGDRTLLMSLPAGVDYAIDVTNDGSAATDSAWLGVMLGGVMFVIDDIQSGVGSADLLTISKDGNVGYQPGQGQEVTVSVATNTPGQPDGAYTVSNAALSPGGGLSMAVSSETGGVVMTSQDPTLTSLNLTVTTVNGTTTATTIYANLPAAPGMQLAATPGTNGAPVVGLDTSGDGVPDTLYAGQPVPEAPGAGTASAIPAHAPETLDIPGPDDLPELADSPPPAIDPGIGDAQTMIEEFQNLSQDAASGSVPGDTAETTGIVLDDDTIDNQPQTVEIPVIVIPAGP